MNKNITPLILIVLALGIYFTFTRSKLDELKSIRAVNAQYQEAIDNSERLVKKRDEVRDTYNKISQDDRENLEKMLPDNVDNVRLIIDVNGVAARHGLALKGIKTSTSDDKNSSPKVTSQSGNTTKSSNTYNTITLTFNVATNYQTFINFLRDLEASLRIMEISKITLDANDEGIYDYGVEIRTFWLK